MRPILIPAALLLMAGCTPHKLEIQQGNIVSEERLSLIKPGMDQQQVRFALGSPLTVDPFHPDRWDYYYQLTREGKPELTYHVTLGFKNGKLASIDKEGTIPPTERAAAELIGHKETREKN